MPTTLLAATTDADQSTAFTVKYDEAPVVFRCPGLAGVEVGTLQYRDASEAWHDYYVDGTLQTITTTNTDLTIYGPGIYRIDKDATAGAASVEISTRSVP